MCQGSICEEAKLLQVSKRSPWFQRLSASWAVTSESKFISGVHRIWLPSLTGSLQEEVSLCSTCAARRLQLEQEIIDWICLCCLPVLHKSSASTRNKENCTQGRVFTQDEHQNRQNSWGGEQAISLLVKQCLEPQCSKYRVREEYASKSRKIKQMSAASLWLSKKTLCCCLDT